MVIIYEGNVCYFNFSFTFIIPGIGFLKMSQEFCLPNC
jgi:hypothetical protein